MIINNQRVKLVPIPVEDQEEFLSHKDLFPETLDLTHDHADTFGQWLRKVLFQLKMVPGELAHELGVNPTVIWELLEDKRRLSDTMADKLGAYLDTDPYSLGYIAGNHSMWQYTQTDKYKEWAKVHDPYRDMTLDQAIDIMKTCGIKALSS